MDSRHSDGQALATIQPVLDDLVPILRRFALGRYAIAISGSYGKGTSDSHSDVDLRLYADDLAGTFAEMGAAIREPQAEWQKKGIKIDDFWPRKIGEVDAALEQWLEGRIAVPQPVWTVWGYYLLPDIYYQRAIDDPSGILGEWKTRLSVYSPKLKQAVLDKHLGSLRYWRHDYHYTSKVERQDAVFLAGLSARLVHDVIQVLFALNDAYYVGDGQNLKFVARFPHQPPEVAKRIQDCLYPPVSDSRFEDQQNTLLALIDDIDRLATDLGFGGEAWSPLA